MKKILLWLTIISSLVGCGQRMVSEELAEADSLLAIEKNDSAYELLSGIRKRYLIDDEDKAYYYLLMTRASILTGNVTPPDSCIDQSISYYERKEDCHTLAEAYYYKAYIVFSKKEFTHAMHLLKEAEKQAELSHDIKQRYKISEFIAHLNSISGNNNLYFKYVRQSLNYAKQLNDSNRIAYSYYRLGLAFMDNRQEDSAKYYILKTVPYIDYVRKEDLPFFLTEIGHVYKYSEPEKAKNFLNTSLKYRELTNTLGHLADIYNKEGNNEEAYRLWKRAIVTDDGIPKEIILYNLLEYDIKHGHIDNVLQKVNDIIDMTDSLRLNLKNDTLKDLQLRFDHEVEKHELDRRLDRSIIAIIVLIVLVVALSLYILIKRYRHRLLWTQTQIQIENYNAQIRQLKESGEDAKQDVTELMARIEALKNSNSMRLNRGLTLYNELKENAHIGKWSKEDYDGFVDYYDAIDHPTVKRHKKEYKNLSQRTLTYLLLKDMGKSDDTIREIMGLSPEGLRSMRFRMKHT